MFQASTTDLKAKKKDAICYKIAVLIAAAPITILAGEIIKAAKRPAREKDFLFPCVPERLVVAVVDDDEVEHVPEGPLDSGALLKVLDHVLLHIERGDGVEGARAAGGVADGGGALKIGERLRVGDHG